MGELWRVRPPGNDSSGLLNFSYRMRSALGFSLHGAHAVLIRGVTEDVALDVATRLEEANVSCELVPVETTP